MGAGDDATAEDFAAAVRARVLRARADLAEAASHRDGASLQSAMDELEEALSMARANGVDVPAPGTAGPEDPA